MNSQVKARVLDLVVQSQQSLTTNIIIDPSDIVEVNTTALGGNPNTHVRLVLGNGKTREFNYNRQSLAVAINSVLQEGKLSLDAITPTAVVAAINEAGIKLSQTDLIVTPLGTAGVKVEASKSNPRFYGSVNLGVVASSETTDPEVPETTDPESGILQLELPSTKAAFLANIYKDNTFTTLLTAQEYSEVTYAYSHDAATNSSTIDAVIHTSIKEADARFYLPVYFGNVAWANYVDGIVAANDHDTVIFRYMDGSNAMDCTIDMMVPLGLTKVNGRYAMVATLWAHDPAVKIALSMDNFATESVYASIRINSQIIAPMPAIEITPLGLSLTLGANQNDFLSRVSIGAFNVNGSSALDDVVYDYVVDDTAKTITATLTATLDAENPADYIVPVYVGDYEFTTYVDRLIARGDTTTIVMRDRTTGGNLLSLTAPEFRDISEKVNGYYTTTVALTTADLTLDMELSVDNFATPSLSYTTRYISNVTIL